MPRFFFELTDGITLKDPNGLWCRDIADARDKAIVIARRVATVEDLSGPPRHISVLDEQGQEVETVIVRARPQQLRPPPDPV